MYKVFKGGVGYTYKHKQKVHVCDIQSNMNIGLVINLKPWNNVAI